MVLTPELMIAGSIYNNDVIDIELLIKEKRKVPWTYKKLHFQKS